MNSPQSNQTPAFFSLGFRPFFFTAAVFAGLAIPVWVMMVGGMMDVEMPYPPREWHVHEMVFGFLPCVMAGFVLTAMPNWTDRPPMMGFPLMGLLVVWLVGRLVMLVPAMTLAALLVLDGAFLIILAGIVWWEIVGGRVWERIPIGLVMSLYATANIAWHACLLNQVATDVAERMGLTLIMVLLALIGGRVTPGFTEDFLEERGWSQRPAQFSWFDGLCIFLILLGGTCWIIQPENVLTGWGLLIAGLVNTIRLFRWHGWLTWSEPLVLVLHLGYGWLAVALLILGSARLGVGVTPEDAVHALTTGAVGVMTLAVMTRASLGHTGRVKHAGPWTVLIYLLANVGALIRVFGASAQIPESITFMLAASCWSGAYLLFAIGYGPMLFHASLEEEE